MTGTLPEAIVDLDTLNGAEPGAPARAGWR